MNAKNALVVVILIALAVSVYYDFTLYSSNQQLIADQDNFNRLINQNSTLNTPITKSQAIAIALAYGGWNASSLRGYTVNATLWNVTITPCPACFGPGSCGVVT